MFKKLISVFLGLAVVLAIFVPASTSVTPVSASIIQGFKHQDLTPKQINSLPSLKECFGHHGILINGFIAGECVYQPSNDGGALYWSFNEANFNWDKHPGDGLLWLEASTVHVATDTSPSNNIHDFWVGIAQPGGVFCTVISPGYDQNPTTCETNGVITTMTSQQQATYDQWAEAMKDANLPDCAWSLTAESSQCDID